MKLKRIIPTMILATMTLATTITAYAKPMPSNAIPTTAKIQYNNEPVQEAKGFIVDGYTYLRLRDMAEIMDFDIEWQKVGNVIFISRNGSKDTIGYGTIDRPSSEGYGLLYNNENYFKVRYMETKLDLDDISYDNKTQIICVTELDNMDTSTSNGTNNTSGTDTSTNNGTTTPNKDTQTISNEITAQDIQDYNEELLRLVNEARVEAGVKPLTLNQELIKITTAKADEMVELDYFSHTSPTYGDFRQFAVAIAGDKYSNKAMGENITKSGTQTKENYYSRDYTRPYGAGCAYTDFLSWWNSQGHKDNMLNPKYTEMGASIGKKDSDNRVGVQMFIY